MNWHRIGVMMLLIGSAGWAQGASPIRNEEKPDARLQKQVDDIARQHHGKVALFAKNLNTGATVAINPDEIVQTASTIKLAALIEGFYQVKAGKKHLDDKVTLR